MTARARIGAALAALVNIGRGLVDRFRRRAALQRAKPEASRDEPRQATVRIVGGFAGVRGRVGPTGALRLRREARAARNRKREHASRGQR